MIFAEAELVQRDIRHLLFFRHTDGIKRHIVPLSGLHMLLDIGKEGFVERLADKKGVLPFLWKVGCEDGAIDIVELLQVRLPYIDDFLQEPLERLPHLKPGLAGVVDALPAVVVFEILGVYDEPHPVARLGDGKRFEQGYHFILYECRIEYEVI